MVLVFVYWPFCVPGMQNLYVCTFELACLTCGGRYLNSACAVAVVCSEGCKVRGYPAESRTLPGGSCVSGDILRPDNSVAYA